MKKFICVMLTIILALSCFTACGAQPADDGILKFAVVQQLDHSSLDEISDATIAQLEKIAAEKGLTIQVEHFNGQNDTSILAQIGATVASSKV